MNICFGDWIYGALISSWLLRILLGFCWLWLFIVVWGSIVWVLVLVIEHVFEVLVLILVLVIRIGLGFYCFSFGFGY